MSHSVRILRALAVAGASLAYLADVFHLADGQFLAFGLGDWLDPYFINGLLEHWRHSALTFSDPASPPMFYPARGALGYSHGLILYAPFYVPLRLFLHPFQAYNLTLFLVLETGIICLYVLLRRLGLSFAGAAVLTAWFASSPNVMHGTTAVWTQRASVFLIPPILLIVHAALTRDTRGRVLPFVGGLLAALMYVQDFYTAHFAAFFAAWFAIAALSTERGGPAPGWLTGLWAARARADRALLALTVAAAIVAAAILLSGGGQIRVFGLRLSARDWLRPAVLALLAFGLVAWRARHELRQSWPAVTVPPAFRASAFGAAAGFAVFLWIYVAAFREHPGFPAQEVWAQLAERHAYVSERTFLLSAVVTLLAWMPWLRVDRRARRDALWFAAASAFVWLAPLKFGAYSLWTVIARLPGFGVIRDPKRIIYLYELAAALAMAAILIRARSGIYRASILAAAVAMLAALPNHERFDYERPNALFDRWVAAPIAIDPACRSFYLEPASADYMSRAPTIGTLYGNDALFLALASSIPTLNGYSAWGPDGWDLWNPSDAGYPARVRAWIAARRLRDVCALDLDARTMRLVTR